MTHLTVIAGRHHLQQRLHVTVAAVEFGHPIDVKTAGERHISKRDDVLRTLGKTSLVSKADTILVDQQSTQALLLRRYSGTVVTMVAAAASQPPINLIEGHVQRWSEESETREQIGEDGSQGVFSLSLSTKATVFKEGICR